MQNAMQNRQKISGQGQSGMSVPVAKPTFTRVNPKEIHFRNLIYSRDTEIGIVVGREDGFFELLPERPELFQGDYITFTLNGHRGLLFITEPLINLILADLNAKLPFYEMPVEMQRAILNAAIARLIKTLNNTASAVNIEVQTYTLSKKGEKNTIPGEFRDSVRLAYRLTLGGQSLYSGLMFTGESRPAVESFIAGCARPELTASKFINVPVGGRVLAGWQSFSLAELRSLALNDIVILETPDTSHLLFRVSNDVTYVVSRQSADVEGQPGTGNGHFKIEREIEGILMEEFSEQGAGEFETTPESMGQPAGQPMGGEAPEMNAQAGGYESGGEFAGSEFNNVSSGPSAGNIPVNLVFEMGRKTLSFEEVQYLEVGYTFDLAVSPQNSVNIMANGVKIGEAEIVDIAGRLGARIVSLKS